MLWSTIKHLLSKGGGKCIIVENEKPVYIVMKVDEYKDLLEKDSQSSETAEINKVNEDINEWQSREKEERDLEESAPREEIKVEDLPF